MDQSWDEIIIALDRATLERIALRSLAGINELGSLQPGSPEHSLRAYELRQELLAIATKPVFAEPTQ